MSRQDSEPHSDRVAAALVENHRELLSFVERRVGDRSVAEDLLQEALARGLERADSIREEESVRAWIYRTLRNAIVDHFRRRGSTERTRAAFAAESPTAAESDGELNKVVCACVSRVAATLKPEYAEVLQRVEVEGVPVKKYAEEHGLSSSNAGVRVFRARLALRKQLEVSCGSCAEHGCLDCTCSS